MREPIERVPPLSLLCLAHVGEEPLVLERRDGHHRLVTEALDESLHQVSHRILQVGILVGAPVEHRRHKLWSNGSMCSGGSVESATLM